jgi:PRTRC genetic system ThiF family protein
MSINPNGYEHHVHPDLISKRVHINLAGAGGTGSQMLTGLARLDAAIRALGHPGLDVAVFDPDEVSVANLGRQLFAPADVGCNKAEVLVTRINGWFGTKWNAVPAKFYGDNGTFSAGPMICVSCVDTAGARVGIGKRLTARKHLYWLDLGNRQADGQVVLGVPAQNAEHSAFEFRLPTVLELFPEIARNAKRLDRDNGPSCSLAQALERQELFVNQSVCTPALQLLWQIFRYGRLTWHGAFVNLTTGRMNPIPVDPQAWRRMGHHTSIVCPNLAAAAENGKLALCGSPATAAKTSDAV